MRIIVLDGYTLNPGDLNWEALRALGECAIFDRTPPARVAERGWGAEAILTNKTPITKTTIDALPALRYIGVLATGYNIVDVDSARDRRPGGVCTSPESDSWHGTPHVGGTRGPLVLQSGFQLLGCAVN
jgi:lactate dehydrogenase-like 2-hydroxyacid dehydrogenase